MGLRTSSLGEAVYDLSADTGNLSKDFDKAEGITRSAVASIGSSLGGIATFGLKAFTVLGTAAVAAVGAMGVAITKLVLDAATLGEQFEQLSLQTSISVTRLQELAYAGTQMDISLDTITTTMARMIRSMVGAKAGTDLAADAYKKLGIQIVDANGNLRDQDLVFAEVIDALGKISNPAERDAMAMLIFGRSAQELNPLIKGGAKALAEFSAEAHDMGAIVSTEGIEALDTFKNNMDALKLSAKGIAATLALFFLPDFNAIQDSVKDFVKGLNKVITQNKGNFWKTAEQISLYLSTRILDLAHSIPTLTKNIKDVIQKIVELFKNSAPALLTAGGTLLMALMDGFWELLPEIKDAVKKIGKTIIDTLGKGIMSQKDKLPKISDILDWIFKTAADLSAKFKAWVDGVDWKKLSDDIAAAISGLPWDTYGSQFGTMASNLWGAIHDAIFGKPVTTMNMTTHEAETMLVGGIDWGALGVALGTAFDNAVIGALHTGLKLGDVTNLAGFQAEWTTIGTQYGKAAGEGMAPLFWTTLWHEVFANARDPVDVFTSMGGPGKVDWSKIWVEIITRGPWSDLDEAINIWFLTHIQNPIENLWTSVLNFFQDPAMWGEVLSGIQKVFIDPLKIAWGNLINSLIQQLNALITGFNILLAAMGMPTLPLIPTSQPKQESGNTYAAHAPFTAIPSVANLTSQNNSQVARTSGTTIQVGDIVIHVGQNSSPVAVGRAAEQGVLRALRAAGAA